MTTVVAVRRGNSVTLGADGQVTLGETVLKGTARKVRTLADDKVVAGFAGSTADAITLFEKFDGQLAKYPGQLARAAVELAKEWRTDKFLRHLEALLVVADAQHTLIITGRGDVLEPEGGVAAVGSGGNYALAAARALLDATELSATEIVRRSLQIAAGICIYTNDNLVVLELDGGTARVVEG